MSLLARISVWTVTKRGHLWAPLLSSCFTFTNPEEAVSEIKPTQCPGAVAAMGQVLASVLISGGLRRGRQHPESLSKRQQVTNRFAPAVSLDWETSPSLTWAMGYSSEEGRARKVCRSLFLGFLWCKEGFAQHAVPAALARVSVTPRFRCIKLWGARQKKMSPRDHWANIILEGSSSVLKTRRYSRSNEKIHCWKKSHRTRNTKANFKKLFVFSRTNCFKLAP